MHERDPAFLAKAEPGLRAAWGEDVPRIVTMSLLVLCGRVR